MKFRQSTAMAMAIAAVLVVAGTDAHAQIKSSSGSKPAVTDVDKDPFEIPMDLWDRGFVTAGFSANDIADGGISARVYQIRGTFAGDRLRLVFNIFPVKVNLKNGIDNRFKRSIKAFGPKYADAGRSKLRVRGGVGRITKTEVDGCKYVVAAINTMRGTVFGEVCGEAITQVTEILREFRVSSPEENRISYNLRRQQGDGATTAAASPTPSVGPELAFTWSKFDGPLMGSMDSQNPLDLKITLPQGLGSCEGFIELKDRAANTGTWFLKCTEGSSASGAFRGNGTGQGATGDGYDNDGNSVQFTIAGR